MRFVSVIALLAVSAPAFAQDAALAPAAPAKKKICRSLDVTGSIMSKRTCHTAEEWRQIDDANGADAQRALAKRRTGTDDLRH